jgi:hypothetical protein
MNANPACGEYAVKPSAARRSAKRQPRSRPRGQTADARTHNLLIIRKNHERERMFSTPRLANSYQIG